MSFTPFDDHFRKRPGFPRKLQPDLFDMVHVNVGVAEGVDEFPGLETSDHRHHQQEQGIGGNVERDAEESVGAPLVELQGQFSVPDIELVQGVAGRKGHSLDFRRVPAGDD